ncbi:adenine-specific DNA-methyltransferase [Arthrobacter pascens]|uniref:DNA methyltransferase n=1 Tax=Arthrobacter pascens TaxID=1677 RepID=UPI00277EB825|nr:DNA methyltransferase [Arthrobacter pascens]MDQ0636358.1 adenine-specific DNA-methyltransferase [Arthrobacter pascens]
MANTLSLLLDRVRSLDPDLASRLSREIEVRSKGVGLVFENHEPEAVALPSLNVKVHNRVAILPPRGIDPEALSSSRKKADRDAVDPLWGTIWTVSQMTTDAAQLVNGPDGFDETIDWPIADLVVMALFREPIYPGLTSTDGKVERGGDKPFHTVINAENFHALELLTYTHQGRVDAIYIDPPYNTRARDWKYNNDYVDPDDDDKHSKWLAFMDRRLRLARKLLNPKQSVLIVTIDEKEYLRLGLLLEQVFSDARIRMISTLINPKGVGVIEGFKRVDEYVYVVRLGAQGVKASTKVPLGSKALGGIEKDDETATIDSFGERDQAEDISQPRIGLDWQTFRRRDLASARGTKKGGPRQFYPIYVNAATGTIEAVGDPLAHSMPREGAPHRPGCVSVFPIREDGTEMNWATTGPSFLDRLEKGYARAGRATPGKPQPYVIQYLKTGSIKAIEEERAVVEGFNPDGSVIAHYQAEMSKSPPTQWNLRSHNAEHYGTKIVRSLLPGRTFPYPKSLFAVEDILRLFVGNKPDALILDFFSGSGTTAHAVMRLNKQDGGNRQCISVTNNEVSADEQSDLRAKHLRPGDPEWESRGICDHITKPRIKAAITGKTPEGTPVNGEYKFTDVFPMADGFEENAEFFTLTYGDPDDIEVGEAFEAIAPLLWLKAGARGPRIDTIPEEGFAVVETYAILFDVDAHRKLIKALDDAEGVRYVYVVTDYETEFARVCSTLAPNVEAERLYSSYLSNFEIV